MRKNKPVSPASTIFLHGILLQNPILVQVVGLCPAVAAAADLYVSALLSVLVTGLLLVSECVASLMLKKVPRRIRVAIYFIIGLLVCAETAFFLEQNAPDLRERAGVYLPLMAASSLVALRCEKVAVKQKLHISFLDALANGLGMSIVLLTCGLVRGLLGSGTIGDLVIFSEPPLRGLGMPFGGFIMLGFMAAFLKWFSAVFLRQNVQMAFGIRRRPRKPEQVVQVQPAASQAPPAQEMPDDLSAPSALPEVPEAPSAEDLPDVPDEEAQSAAETFYEQAAEDPQADLSGDLFTELDRSVSAELDEIWQSINGMEFLLTEGDANDDA